MLGAHVRAGDHQAAGGRSGFGAGAIGGAGHRVGWGRGLTYWRWRKEIRWHAGRAGRAAQAVGGMETRPPGAVAGVAVANQILREAAERDSWSRCVRWACHADTGA